MGYDLDLGVLGQTNGSIWDWTYDNDRGLNPLEPRVTGAECLHGSSFSVLSVPLECFVNPNLFETTIFVLKW